MEFGGGGEKERGQICAGIDAHGAIVNVASAKLVFRGNVVIHRRGQVLEVRKVWRLNRKQADRDWRCSAG